MITTKVCSKCKRELPTNQFQKDTGNSDGYYSSCKNCKREYKHENRDRLIVAQYERIATDKTILPKRRAWNALYYALKTGKIYKPEYCSICGSWVGTDKIQAHHKDYSKLFEVTWCCQDCHVTLDKIRRKEQDAKLLVNS
jgi:hypothetical protein